MSYFPDDTNELIKKNYDVFMYHYRSFGSSDEFEIDKNKMIYKENFNEY